MFGNLKHWTFVMFRLTLFFFALNSAMVVVGTNASCVLTLQDGCGDL